MDYSTIFMYCQQYNTKNMYFFTNMLYIEREEVLNLINQRLKQLRTENHLTQAQLAEILGIAKTTLAAYEQGKSEPNIELLIRMSNYFCVTVDYLIGKTNCSNSAYQPIADSLGIDERTIDILKSLAGNPDDGYFIDITELDCLEAIMQHPQFPTLMSQINSYYVYTTADWSNYPPYYVDPNGQKIPITIEDLKNSALQIIQTTFKGIVESIPTAPHILNKE